MASGSGFGGSEMAAILQNQGISSEAIEALLATTSSPKFHGSRSMVNLEDIHGGGGGGPNECSFFHNIDMDECVNDDYEEGFSHPGKKRRLTSTQVQFLEKSFDTGNKLEPERKIQLAKDLGLQPRQVAIWFQNRRARWKTKQLERDYETLKLNYDHLKGNLDSLQEEKEKLKTEVMALKEKLEERGKNNVKTLNHQELVTEVPGTEEEEEEEKLELPMVCKQEEICSTNSVVLDSDIHNSNIQNSDRKFPKLEDNTCGFGFPDEEEETDLWSWNY